MPVVRAPLRRFLLLSVLVAGTVSAAAAQLLEVEPFVALEDGRDVRFGPVTIAPGADASVTLLAGTWDNEISKQVPVVRRFSPTGIPEIALTSVDDGEFVASPRIASDSRGGFIALWRRAQRTILYARLLNAAGTPTTPELQVATGTLQYAAGGFAAGSVVAWSGQLAVKLRLYDVAGEPNGSDVTVADVASFSVVRLGVERVSGGGFVVAWDETGRVRARLYDAAGTALGDPIDVSDEFEMGAVAPNPLGGFVVVGARRVDTHARPSGVWARRFDAAGVASGPAFVVDLVDPEFAAFPRAAFDGAGRLYVVWDTSSTILLPRGRVYDPDGRPLTAPFAIIDDDFVSGLIVIARPDGRFVEGWHGLGTFKMQVRALCVPPDHTSCGDGSLELPCERCDAGGANSDTTPDVCRTTCALPSCSDGVVDHNESCDDGNRRGCDGCDAQCSLEVGWVCGDGAVSADCDEQCDDGPGNDDTLPNACRTDCRSAHCGDGVLDDGEACDDGNRTSCDGCSDLCVFEPGLVCGDGIPELLCGEQCDDANAVIGDGCKDGCTLERIPGGGSPKTDCEIEWVIENPANEPRYDKFGAINVVQQCTDGDSRCDFDGVAGTCTFHVRVCANNTDIPACVPGSRLRTWELRSPSAKRAATRPQLAAVRAAFASVPGAIVGPPASDVCSDVLAVPVAVKTSVGASKAGSLTLKTSAVLYSGERDSDKLKLICRP